jgi:hypothetical protein
MDPAHFAARVRQIALDAHRILNDPFVTSRELVELSGRLDELWRNCPGHRSSGLDRWLRNTRDLVDSREALKEGSY